MGSLKTLITIDDERFVHMGLDKLIKWEEYNIKKIGESYDGDSALELIKKNRPNVILTDIRMPGLDGLSLISMVSNIQDYNPEWIIISGYESFSYAKKAMNYGVKYYLLKPIDENELIKILMSLKLKFVEEDKIDLKAERRLLVSASIKKIVTNMPSLEHLERTKEILGNIKPSRYCQIIFQDNTEENIDPILRRILINLNAVCASERISQIKKNQIGIILTEAEVPERDLKNFICKLQKNCSKVLNKNVYVSVGIYVNSLTDLYKSFLSSQMVINKILFQNSDPFFIIDDLYELEKSTNFDLAKKIMFFPELLTSIEDNNFEGIENNIDSIFNWIKKNNVSPLTIKLWINCLIIDVTRLILELGGTQHSNINEFRNKVLTDPFLLTDDLFVNIISFCKNSGKYISVIKKNNKHGVISAVIQNIKENYNKHISLKLLGEQYSQNPVYLGQLFKQTIGVSFKSFLAETRVAEAKKLLTRTDLKVYEVSKSVGYSDCDYFSKQFIKITGKSPCAYKKHN